MKESYEWVLACINSCKTKFQLESCKVLVSLFKIKYEDEAGKLIGELESAIYYVDTFLSVDA